MGDAAVHWARKRAKKQERELARHEAQEILKTTEKKSLFEEEEEEKLVKVNKKFEAEFNKKKEELEITNLKRHVLDDDDDDSSEGTEEDEKGVLLDDEREYGILAALADIKAGRKQDAAAKIEKVNTEVKEELSKILEGKTTIKEAEKKFTLHDYKREKLLEKGAEGVATLEEDEERAYEKKWKPTSRKEEDEAKQKFIEVAEDEEDGFVLRKADTEAEEGEEEEEEEVQIDHKEKERQINDKLAELFNDVNPTDSKEMFLKNFFLSHGWQTGGSYGPTEDEVEELMEQGCEEEEFFERQAAFEENFEKTKYHHEEQGAELIESHPRPHKIEDSLRKTDNPRKAARQRKKEREQEATLKRDEEVKRLKFLKRQEMDKKLQKLQDVAGKSTEELFDLADVDEDFDPDKWDEKMANMFDDKYYDDEDEDFDPGDGDFDQDEEEQVDESDEKEEKPTKKKKKKDKKKTADELTESDKKELQQRKRQLLKSIEEEIEKDMDLYNKLDYEDVVAGKKVRFKYKQVPKEQFGFTDEEVLTYDDRSLNNAAPLKWYAPYRSKSDNYRDRAIALQNKKMLPALEEYQPPVRTSRKYRQGMLPVEVTPVAPVDLKDIEKQVKDETKKKEKKKRNKENRKKRKLEGEDEEGAAQPQDVVAGDTGENKKKKKKKAKSTASPEDEHHSPPEPEEKSPKKGKLKENRSE